MSANEDPMGGFQAARRSLPFYFVFQCQQIGFSEWISLLTLCLAPLIAHIFVGAPAPVELTELREPADPVESTDAVEGAKPAEIVKPMELTEASPRWYERMLHFNPTSIYWRYYAIVIRLAGAESWGADDTAATNAIFFVGGKQRWDGSEAIMIESRNYTTEEAPRRRISWISPSAFMTTIVTIQGLQAVYDLVGRRGMGEYALTVSLPNIFRPLAIAGLFRLPASMWLTDDHHYDTDRWKADRRDGRCYLKNGESAPKPPPKFSFKYWLVMALRVLFLAPTAVLLFLASYYFQPNPRVTAGTASTLLMNLLYVLFLVVTLLTTLAYSIQGQSNTTIIPCINSRWYMAYTCFLFTGALVLLVLTALQTRKTACGETTTYPSYLEMDRYICTNVSVPGSGN